MRTRPTYLTPGVRAKLASLGHKVEHVGRVRADAGTATADPPEDVTIPDTPAGLEEMLADPKQMKALFAKKDGFAGFVRAYAKTVLDKDQEIATQVREETQRVLSGFLKEQRDKDGAPLTPINLGGESDDLMSFKGWNWTGAPDPRAVQRQGLFNPKAMGAVLDQEFKGPHATAEFFQLVWKDHRRMLDAQGAAKLHRVRNAFSSDVPSDGGFLIPERLRSDLLRVALESAVVRSRARVIPMETLKVPFPAIDSTSHESSIFGGVTASWTEEGADITSGESAPKFKRIVLDAKKLTAYTEVPQELIADSLISFVPFINDVFPEALAWFEDIAFMKGTGVGEPLGALRTDNPATIAVTRSTGTPDIDFEDVVNMFARMLPSSLGRAVWVASIDAFPALASMAVVRAEGVASPAVWLNNGQVIGGPPATILGRPVVFTEKAPASVGSQGDLSFVDFGFYLIGDRQAMSASSSEHFRFGNDRIAFKVIERADGRPWIQSPITPENGGPTLSPFVQLAT